MKNLIALSILIAAGYAASPMMRHYRGATSKKTASKTELPVRMESEEIQPVSNMMMEPPSPNMRLDDKVVTRERKKVTEEHQTASNVKNQVETVSPTNNQLSQEIDGKSAKITGGKMAEKGQFPFQAGLLTKRGDRFSWCGGSLISDEWILTAAHCVEGVTKQVGVFLGTNNIEKLENDTQIFWVKNTSNLIPHEDYYSNPTTIWNDIALIKLPEKIKINDKVKPVKLAARSDAEKSYVGEEIRTSGWGLTRDSDRAITKMLRFVDTPILDMENCSEYYRPGSILPIHVCMDTAEGKSACSGDSGGPLVLKGTDIQIGLTSFGKRGQCEKGVPSVFTRISFYLDWIAEKTGLDV